MSLRMCGLNAFGKGVPMELLYRMVLPVYNIYTTIYQLRSTSHRRRLQPITHTLQ